MELLENAGFSFSSVCSENTLATELIEHEQLPVIAAFILRLYVEGGGGGDLNYLSRLKWVKCPVHVQLDV